MKKLLLSVLLLGGLLGYVGNVDAAAGGWSTTRSTAVIFSTGSNLELNSVAYSSGSTTWGNAWLVFVDSSPVRTADGVGNDLVDKMLLSEFPVTQYAFPPLMLFSSATINASPNTYNYIDFRDKFTGEGKRFKNGIVMFIESAVTPGPGTIVTVEYGKKR